LELNLDNLPALKVLHFYSTSVELVCRRKRYTGTIIIAGLSRVSVQKGSLPLKLSGLKMELFPDASTTPSRLSLSSINAILGNVERADGSLSVRHLRNLHLH